jgi:hypothetical protein
MSVFFDLPLGLRWFFSLWALWGLGCLCWAVPTALKKAEGCRLGLSNPPPPITAKVMWDCYERAYEGRPGGVLSDCVPLILFGPVVAPCLAVWLLFKGLWWVLIKGFSMTRAK